ncbi:MAG TPA: HEAT repeat domain-containing protein [Anaeromyxobacter sp.]
MSRLAASVVLATALVAAASESQVDAAVRALRKDSSLKVRTQAAVVLGQRGAVDAVAALREAVAGDDASAVRLAAVTALGKIRDRSARPTLRAASEADPDDAVRKAARRALDDLGPLAFSIEETRGAGSAATRDALRQAIAAQLKGRGFAVVDRGGVVLKPSVMKLDVDAHGGKTTIAVKATLVAVDDDGKMAAMLESGAKLSATGVIPDAKIPAYSARALEAAAKTLCEDLAAKLGER